MPARTRSTLNRLAALEHRGSITGRNKPVAMFPRLVSVDDWEAIAKPAQQRLKQNIREDTPPDYSGIPEFELVPSG